MNSVQVQPIGRVSISGDGMSIKLDKKYLPALQALEGFSHLNVIWWFDECDTAPARSILEVPKPYTKAPEIMGVFATRSPARPNPVALTAVQVLWIDYDGGIIHIAYIDANDGSPVLDLKPYTPSLDRVETP